VAPPHWLYVDAYLPELWLPERRIWLEVKPHAPNLIEYRMAALLAECTGSSVLVTGGGPNVIETAQLVKGIGDYKVVSTLGGSAPIKFAEWPALLLISLDHIDDLFQRCFFA